MKYYVTENTPGYLPDTEPATFEGIKQAEDYADSLAMELINMPDETWTVVLNDFVKNSGHGRIYLERYPGDLGRVIEWGPVVS
jgi:hypothetical protein